MTQKALIWDLPTRICHWAFAISLTACFVLALGFDEHDALFRYHMLFGMLAGAALVLRLALGVLGSRFARFSSFPVRPRLILAYFQDVLLNKNDSAKHHGNNPGSALAALAMFGLVPLILITGLTRQGEISEELHGALAFALGGVISLHLIGIIVHTVRTRENIGVAMITGKKTVDAPVGLESAHSVWGLAMLVLFLVWAVALFNSYNSTQGTVKVPLLGNTIQLATAEGQGKRHDVKDLRERREHRD